MILTLCLPIVEIFTVAKNSNGQTLTNTCRQLLFAFLCRKDLLKKVNQALMVGHLDKTEKNALIGTQKNFYFVGVLGGLLGFFLKMCFINQISAWSPLQNVTFTTFINLDTIPIWPLREFLLHFWTKKNALMGTHFCVFCVLGGLLGFLVFWGVQKMQSQSWINGTFHLLQ